MWIKFANAAMDCHDSSSPRHQLCGNLTITIAIISQTSITTYDSYDSANSTQMYNLNTTPQHKRSRITLLDNT